MHAIIRIQLTAGRKNLPFWLRTSMFDCQPGGQISQKLDRGLQCPAKKSVMIAATRSRGPPPRPSPVRPAGSNAHSGRHGIEMAVGSPGAGFSPNEGNPLAEIVENSAGSTKNREPPAARIGPGRRSGRCRAYRRIHRRGGTTRNTGAQESREPPARPFLLKKKKKRPGRITAGIDGAQKPPAPSGIRQIPDRRIIR